MRNSNLFRVSDIRISNFNWGGVPFITELETFLPNLCDNYLVAATGVKGGCRKYSFAGITLKSPRIGMG